LVFEREKQCSDRILGNFLEHNISVLFLWQALNCHKTIKDGSIKVDEHNAVKLFGGQKGKEYNNLPNDLQHFKIQRNFSLS